MSLIDKVEQILAFVQAQTGADQAELIEFKQLSGGAIQDNYGLKLNFIGGSMPGEQSFVIRSDAPSSLSVSLSRPQEYQVISLAYANGVKAPKPYWLCTDLNVIGQEFYVMQWVAGSAAAHRLVSTDALTTTQRQDLCFDLGREIALLHQIPYSATTLDFLKKPLGNAAQQRIDEYQTALDRLPQPEPIIELGLQVLRDHLPTTGTRVLCHCDYRTGNYMVQDGALTAILDWEFTAWSDIYEDLGWFCARSWRFGHNEHEAGGIGHKSDFFAGYSSVSQHAVDPDLVKYWELMASVRWAIIALEQAQRFIANQEQSIELALTGRMAPEIQLDLMLHIFDVLGTNYDLAQLSADTFDNLNLDSSTAYDALYDQPHGVDLLSVARTALYQEILPTVAKDLGYTTRMIASAMGMIEREISMGPAVNARIHQLIQDFYGATISSPADGLQQLARDIRTNNLTPVNSDKLVDLLLQILILKLKITNPRRLAKI